MKELVKWLKDNLGDNFYISTPQFKRKETLEYNYIPETPWRFRHIVENAPVKILLGCGFRKWDTMNNLIRENRASPRHDVIKIPVINSNEPLIYDLGHGNSPTEFLKVDEDVLLFPEEWYQAIPDGFIVTGLYGEQYPFKKGESDDDIRFGCLAYGIRRAIK
jgi:hypothetical protein